jgi:hypothetical protein
MPDMYTGFAIPRLRVRQNDGGTLDAIPAPDLPPWEASEGWWQSVLTNPRPSRKARLNYESHEARTLADVKSDRIEITCTKCDLRRQLVTNDLRLRFGSEHSLPTLLYVLAEGCPRVAARQFGDWCGAEYTSTSLEAKRER